jgi:hypothetical protein
LFWTIPIDPSWVSVQWPAGHASLLGSGVHIDDYGNFFNSIIDGPSKEAVTSFRITWTEPIQRVTIDDSNNRGFGGSDWGGHFAVMDATAEWRMTTDGFWFTSDPATTVQPVFAFLGEERNGIYFPG